MRAPIQVCSLKFARCTETITRQYQRQTAYSIQSPDALLVVDLLERLHTALSRSHHAATGTTLHTNLHRKEEPDRKKTQDSKESDHVVFNQWADHIYRVFYDGVWMGGSPGGYVLSPLPLQHHYSGTDL